MSKENTTVSEAEICTEMVKKEECNKELERKKYEHKINTMEINHNQVANGLNNKRKEIITLKGGGKNKMKHEERKEEKKQEFWKFKKKEGRAKSKDDKELDNWLEDEFRSVKETK